MSPETFLSKINKTGDCWLWTGYLDKLGYGYVSMFGRRVAAYRVSYLFHKGWFAEEQWVLHKCDNPPCVNPDHLFLGDAQSNVADMCRKGRHASILRNHCRNGHPYEGDNVYVYKEKGKPRRVCRECQRQAVARYAARKARR